MFGTWTTLPHADFRRRLMEDENFRKSPAAQSALAFTGDLVRLLFRAPLVKGELPGYVQPVAKLFDGGEETRGLLTAIKEAYQVHITIGCLLNDEVQVLVAFSIKNEKHPPLKKLSVRFLRDGSARLPEHHVSG